MLEWYATFLSIQVILHPCFYPQTCWKCSLATVLGDTCWCFSAVLLKSFCCSTFLLKHNGNLWPKDGIQNKQTIRTLLDKRHGSVSLIPLRGSENEMRKSVAAFSQESLSVSKQKHQ